MTQQRNREPNPKLIDGSKLKVLDEYSWRTDKTMIVFKAEKVSYEESNIMLLGGEYMSA